MALHLDVDREHPDDKPLVLAAEVIQAGGVIVYPTETVYGIGANALSPDAIKKVQAVKKRADPKPMLVLIPTLEALRGLVIDISVAAQKLIDAFWPGPLTLVFKASACVPRELTSGTGTVGARIPSSALCKRLLELAGCPITSTSANLTGEPSPASAAEIQRTLGTAVDLFLDAGTLPPREPSTVIDVSSRGARLIRSGAIPLEQIARVITLSPNERLGAR